MYEKMKTPKTINNYQVAERIGMGAVGAVYKGISDTGEIVAIKQISLHNISNDKLQSIETEINLLKKLNHENIVKYKEYIKQKHFLNIILEYVEGGSLHSFIKKSGAIPEKTAQIYIKQVLTGLEYLHNQGIVHRDIKGGNILFTKEPLVKLADFGFAVILTDNEKTNSVVGTPYWMSPEVIESKGNMSPACDIWSLGCTIIELLTGQPPYYNLELYGAMFRIVTDEHPPIPEGVSPNLVDFLKKCFVKDPEARASASELLKHAWITSFTKIGNEMKNRDSGNNLNVHQRSNSGQSEKNDKNRSVDSKINNNFRGSNFNDDDEISNDIRKIKEKRGENSFSQSEIEMQYVKKDLANVIISPRNSNVFENLKENNFSQSRPNQKNTRNVNYKSSTKELDQEEKNDFNDTKFSSKNRSSDAKLKNSEHYNPQISLNKEINSIWPLETTLVQNKKKKQFDPKNLNADKIKPSLSFQDENFCYKTKSTISEEEKEKHDYLGEININANGLKEVNKKNISQYLNDINLKSSYQEILKKTNNSAVLDSEIKTHLEIKLNLESLNNIQNLNDKQLLVILINIANLLIDNKISITAALYKILGVPSFVNILNYQNLNNRIIYIYLFIINQMLSEENSTEFLRDLIIYQFFIYITRLSHIYSDWEIKSEITLIIVEIINRQHLIGLFVPVGGFFITLNLLEPVSVKNCIYVSMIAVNVLIEILLKLENQRNDIAGFFINNKLLSRLNILIFEIFSEDNITEKEELIFLLDRILDLILILTETPNLEKICSNGLISSLMNLWGNFQNFGENKILKILDNIMKDTDTKNKLENLGIIEFLVKVLDLNVKTLMSYSETDPEYEGYQKITKNVLHLIRMMCKLNSARLEQLAILEGVPLLMKILNKINFSETIISILCEMISSTKKVREILKEHLDFKLVIRFVMKSKNSFPDLISKIIDWLNADKEYIESILLNDNSLFDDFFKEIYISFSDNSERQITTLLYIFDASTNLQKKFFDNLEFTELLMKKIEKVMSENKEAGKTKKLLDIIESFILLKQKDESFKKFNVKEMLDKLLSLAKSENWVIIEGKLNNIFSKFE